MAEPSPKTLRDLLQAAVRRGDLEPFLHQYRENVFDLLSRDKFGDEIPIDSAHLDIYLHEYCPEINLEAQYHARLAELADCGVTQVDENGRPSITAIDGKKYPAPTLADIRNRFTVEKIRRICTLPTPRIMLLTPFGMSLKELANRVTGTPGNIPGGQVPLYTRYDLDADLPVPDNGKQRLIYDPQRFDPDNHGGVSKSEILKKNPWEVIFVDARTEIGQVSYKNAHDFLSEFQIKGWDGLRPEDYLALHAHAVASGQPYDDRSWIYHLGAFLINSEHLHLTERVKFSGVPNGFWIADARELNLTWGMPSNVSGGVRAAVRV